jgi:hypothetical protein
MNLARNRYVITMPLLGLPVSENRPALNITISSSITVKGITLPTILSWLGCVGWACL